jgi:DNA ligase (NAD+)
VLEKLEQGGVAFPREQEEAKAAPLAGKTFVLTGGLDSFTRDEARQKIEALGGRVSSSVSKKTDYVVVGKDPGSKYDQARQLGIETLEEDHFKELIGHVLPNLKA